MRINRTKYIQSLLLFALIFLTGCGGGGKNDSSVECLLPFLSLCGNGSGGTPPAATYTIGGTITGLTVTGLVLSNNGGIGKIVPSGATSFSFSANSEKIADGSTYAVTILTQPTGVIR